MCERQGFSGTKGDGMEATLFHLKYPLYEGFFETREQKQSRTITGAGMPQEDETHDI